MSVSVLIFMLIISTLFGYLVYLLSTTTGGSTGKKQLQISKKDILEQAEILSKQQKYRVVEKLAKKYLETNPEHTKLRFLLAKALFNEDEIYEAIKECAIILTSLPGDFSTRLLLARCYAKINQKTKAIQEFQSILKQNPDNMVALNELSNLYLDTNQKSLALKTLNKLVNLTENNLELADIKTRIADLNIELGNYSDAFDVLNSILEIYPENNDIHKKLIELYMKVNNTERAIASCEELLAINSDNSLGLWLLNNLVNLFYQEKDVEKTLEYAQKMLDHPFSDKTKTKIYMAKVLISSGRDQEGMELLESLSQANKENLEVKYLQIESFINKNRFADAVEIYKEILDIVGPLEVQKVHTGMSNLFVRWAKYCFDKNNQDECFKLFNVAIQYDNENPEVYYELGEINMIIKNYNEAIIDYKKAIGIKPNELKYYISIADAYENISNTIEQKVALLKALSIDKNNTEVLYKLSVLYDSQHDRIEQIKALERVIELDPNHIDAKYQLALILESQGNVDGALKLYREIEQIDYNYKNVREYIAALSKEDESQEP